MTQWDCFLEDIIAEPDDDAVRLIAADWLDENGDSERAEFIRVQCELAAMKDCEHTSEPFFPKPWFPASTCRFCILRCREHCLLRAHWRSWTERFRNLIVPILTDWCEEDRWTKFCEFRRGFVESITCTAADWIEHADAIRAEHPVMRVSLTTRATMMKIKEYHELQNRYRANNTEHALEWYVPAADEKSLWEGAFPGIEFEVIGLDEIARQEGYYLRRTTAH